MYLENIFIKLTFDLRIISYKLDKKNKEYEIWDYFDAEKTELITAVLVLSLPIVNCPM